MMGVGGAGIPRQVAFVKECCSPSIAQEITSKSIHALACNRNGEEGFEAVESDFLFAFVAAKKPRQIFQVGCGVSMAVCLLAAEYVNYTPEVTCIEPYPTNYLLQLFRVSYRGSVNPSPLGDG
jgi:hypothetical protein